MNITDQDMEILKRARQSLDWSECTTSKLRYLYIKYIALPAGRMDQLKAIQALSHRESEDDLIQTAQEIFNPKPDVHEQSALNFTG